MSARRLAHHGGIVPRSSALQRQAELLWQLIQHAAWDVQIVVPPVRLVLHLDAQTFPPVSNSRPGSTVLGATIHLATQAPAVHVACYHLWKVNSPALRKDVAPRRPWRLGNSQALPLRRELRCAAACQVPARRRLRLLPLRSLACVLIHEAVHAALGPFDQAAQHGYAFSECAQKLAVVFGLSRPEVPFESETWPMGERPLLPRGSTARTRG